jgi:hypothetical protein
MKALFNKAIAEAMVKETEDNDGLPSEDFAFQMVVESSPNKKKRSGRKSSSKKYYLQSSKIARLRRILFYHYFEKLKSSETYKRK